MQLVGSSRPKPKRNSHKALHGAGNRSGFHAFRRFRFSVLRRAGVPENLIKQWLGHSQNLVDLCAAQLRYDVAHRREWCEMAGLGFELGELGYNWEFQFARHSLRRSILRQALEMVAGVRFELTTFGL
jgi:hypothetical protein